MTADLLPGEFVKVALHRTGVSLFSPEPVEQVFWVFARYVSTVDRQMVVEYADGQRTLVDADNVHPLEPAPISEGGAT